MLSFIHNKRHVLKLQLEIFFHLLDNIWAMGKWASYTVPVRKNGTISMTAIWQHLSKSAQTFDPAIQLLGIYLHLCTIM